MGLNKMISDIDMEHFVSVAYIVHEYAVDVGE